MQLTLGRVHWGWCVFPLHNQSLTQTLADHRFSVTIILGGDSWTLIIILWWNPENLPNTPHLTPDDVAPPATATSIKRSEIFLYRGRRKIYGKRGEKFLCKNPKTFKNKKTYIYHGCRLPGLSQKTKLESQSFPLLWFSLPFPFPAVSIVSH